MIRSLSLTAVPVALSLWTAWVGPPEHRPFGAVVPGSDRLGATAAELAAHRGPEAERIRETAGLPPGVVPGPGPAARPGLASPRRLVLREPIRIQSREDARALAHRGTGTALDPYVLADLALVGHGSAEPFGVFWSDPFASYHLRLENVRIEGWASAQIYVRSGTGLVLRHAELRGSEASGAAGLRIAGGALTVEECAFSGLAGDGIQIVGEAPVSVAVTDSRFDEAGGAWGAAARGIHNLNRGGAVTVEVLRCDFDAPSMTAAVRPWRSAECRLQGSRFATRIGLEEGDDPSTGLLVASCLFETSREAILGRRLLDWEVAHCEFRDNEAGRRLVRLAECGTGSLHHSVLTKTRGGPEDACLEAIDCRGLDLGHNWVTAAPGAAFRLARLDPDSRVHDSVGDGILGAFVTWADAPGERGAIHDLWTDLAATPSRLAAPVALDGSGADSVAPGGGIAPDVRLASASAPAPDRADAGS